jgi:lipopolysaccharide heptosyltransferase II
MNLNFQRRIDRYLGSLICRILSILPSARRSGFNKVKPKKILVILLSEMGSLVLAYPMFQQIERRYPDASIHVLLFERNREILDIIDVIPGTHVLTLSDRSMAALARDSIRMLRTMRAIKFDAVIDCELFARISAIFSFFSGASLRVGFDPYTQEGLYRGSFINRPVLYNPYQHISRQFLTLVEALESDTVPFAKRSIPPAPLEVPLVNLDKQKVQEITQRLHLDHPAVTDKTLVLVYPSGGILPIRAWPLEHYTHLCEKLLYDGYAVGIIGMDTDTTLAQAIRSHCLNPLCIDLTGYTKSILELLGLFYRASLLVTNDGGPGQLAALTTIPTIIFYGPETPALYGSLSQEAYFYHLPFSCSPCVSAYNHRQSPCDGDNQCLKQIDPDQVFARAIDIMVNARQHI